MRWQRRARLVAAAVAIAIAAGVAVRLRPRTSARTDTPVPRTDPNAVVESAGGIISRTNREHEDVRVQYDRLLSYSNGTSKLLGVKVTTERAGGRTFTVTGQQGEVGDRESNVSVAGNVRVTASDGLELTTDRADYSDADGMVRAPGPVRFSRGRMSGAGTGFTYDNKQNILTILDAVTVRTAPDKAGAGGMEIEAGSLTFQRNDKLVRFDRTMKATREHEIIEAAAAIAHLSADEERIESVELRGNSHITGTKAAAGGLQALTGRDMDLKYGSGGAAIEHATIVGDAVIQVAGDHGQAGRQIAANTLDVTLAPDGTTPIALSARDNVRLTIPGEQKTPARTIAAQTLDSQGDAQHGLTTAHFAGNVVFSERTADLNRSGRSAVLDLALAPGFGSIDEARFAQNVRFNDGDLNATAAAARYVLTKGTLELTGSEPASPAPHVVNAKVRVDAARIDVTLESGDVKAAGNVKSVIQPQKDRRGDDATHIPSMLKQDQPVNVTANDMTYDGNASRAVYTGAAQLWQAETTIKATSIAIDSKSGDLVAVGPVTTSAVLLQENKEGQKERIRSIGSAKDFKYEDSARRATYSGEAHLSGPQGDTTAPRIELYLNESGEEVERAEAYDGVTLRDQNRQTTGNRLTYRSADQSYVVTGTPVSIVDECGRETVARTLTFFRTTDRIIVDGNEQVRTQTKGKSSCS